MFRPAVRVTAPDGREWELYAYRIVLPQPPLRDRDDVVGSADLRLQVLAGAFDGALWLVGRVGRLLALLVWHVPRAALRALGSDEWTIEAVTWQPHRTAYTWRTTREFRGHVLAQVEGQLARGETPTPRHATYLGLSG